MQGVWLSPPHHLPLCTSLRLQRSFCCEAVTPSRTDSRAPRSLLFCAKDVIPVTVHAPESIPCFFIHPLHHKQTAETPPILEGRRGEGRQRKERESPPDFLCAIAVFSFHFKNKIHRSVFFTAFLYFFLPQTADLTVLSFDFTAALK